jgi:hypothetical protein
LQYFAFSTMALLVIVFFTFGWPLFTYLTLKHLFDQHAVTVRLADLPPDEASAIIHNNRPSQAEERCAPPNTVGFEKLALNEPCESLDLAMQLHRPVCGGSGAPMQRRRICR